MKVYTKTGDGGETSLYSGGRVFKTDPRIEAYGTIDELNSLLGLLASESLPKGMAEQLTDIQSVLFDIGASMADAEAKLATAPAVWDTGRLESWIDAMDAGLEDLRAFILPGGSRPAALAHLARTVCRRAERRVVAVAQVDSGIIPYLNRLSDALFVAARQINAERGIADPEWRRGA